MTLRELWQSYEAEVIKPSMDFAAAHGLDRPDDLDLRLAFWGGAKGVLIELHERGALLPSLDVKRLLAEIQAFSDGDCE
jgi:hypothetical protein